MANLGGLLNELQLRNEKKKKRKNNSNEVEVNYSDCDITYVYNVLQRSPFFTYYILIDVRNFNEYNTSCIYQSISMDIDGVDDMNTINKLSEIPCNKPNNLKFIETKKIIIYHNNKNYKNSNYEKK
eukprot:69032_1